jgi:hypothetical protein
MQWIAPSEKDTTTDRLEKRLYDAADHPLAPQVFSGFILDFSFCDDGHDATDHFDFDLPKPMFYPKETEPSPSLQTP